MSAPDALRTRQRTNRLQTWLLLVAAGLIPGLLGFLLGGITTMVLLFLSSALLIGFSPRWSATAILRLYHAEPMTARQAPALHQALEILCQRGGLRLPRLFYLPSPVVNAFALGDPRDASIVLTDGLLRKLTPGELNAVLAHELSHIRHNDLQVMAMADVLSRLTHSLSLLGWIMLLFHIPLTGLGHHGLPLSAMIVMILAPQLSALLQLALSRTREFDADLGAAELTGEPQALAAALAKLDFYSRSVLERVFSPGHQNPEPSLLRTHPPVAQRIARLKALQRSLNTDTATAAIAASAALPPRANADSHPRKRWISGLWY